MSSSVIFFRIDLSHFSWRSSLTLRGLIIKHCKKMRWSYPIPLHPTSIIQPNTPQSLTNGTAGEVPRANWHRISCVLLAPRERCMGERQKIAMNQRQSMHIFHVLQSPARGVPSAASLLCCLAFQLNNLFHISVFFLATNTFQYFNFLQFSLGSSTFGSPPSSIFYSPASSNSCSPLP
jgi:hypothetical protein